MSAHPESQAMDERTAERLAYLGTTPVGSARLVRLGSDASIRQYFRLEGGPVPALLMDAPSAAVEAPCPPEADEQERTRLGYGAMVRGSGSSLVAFGAAAQVLAGCGILVPRVLHGDARRGFAVIEDLGNERVADAAQDPAEEARLYHQAADVLDRLRSAPVVPGERHGWPFQAYDHLAYETEAELLASWYFPKILGRALGADKAAALAAAWRGVFAHLSPPDAWVHRDFHADNLMVVGKALGVLDFQDLMVGQAAYDWASLIEDARRDVAPGLAAELYARGVEGAVDPASFARDYAILAAQRNAKILGLFARLAARDGKDRYLDLIPRVRRFFAEDLTREPLTEVRRVLGQVAPEVLEP